MTANKFNKSNRHQNHIWLILFNAKFSVLNEFSTIKHISLHVNPDLDIGQARERTGLSSIS